MYFRIFQVLVSNYILSSFLTLQHACQNTASATGLHDGAAKADGSATVGIQRLSCHVIAKPGDIVAAARAAGVPARHGAGVEHGLDPCRVRGLATLPFQHAARHSHREQVQARLVLLVLVVVTAAGAPPVVS
jgi:hypothetical protein